MRKFRKGLVFELQRIYSDTVGLIQYDTASWYTTTKVDSWYKKFHEREMAILSRIGNATLVGLPENLGSGVSNVFKLVKPGFVCGQKPGFDGFKFRASVLHRKAHRNWTVKMLRNCTNDKSVRAAVKSEIAVFECSGVRGRMLQLVYSYLQSIPPPISVEAECGFCAAGILCTKIRSRLSDP